MSAQPADYDYLDDSRSKVLVKTSSCTSSCACSCICLRASCLASSRFVLRSVSVSEMWRASKSAQILISLALSPVKYMSRLKVGIYMGKYLTK